MQKGPQRNEEAQNGQEKRVSACPAGAVGLCKERTEGTPARHELSENFPHLN